jgi:antitoxin VapB
MPLNIKDPETERLAVEVAELTGESKTGAVRAALRERKARLLVARSGGGRAERMLAVLEGQVWPLLPETTRGGSSPRKLADATPGFGPDDR